MALPELFANPATPGTPLALTTLGAAVTDTTGTTITTSAGAPSTLQASGQFRILVGSELMIVTAGANGTSWTVTRGAEGSTAATHSSGDQIWHLLTAGALGGQSDPAAGTPGLRTLGKSAAQAAKGDDTEYAFSMWKLVIRAATGVGSAQAAGTLLFLVQYPSLVVSGATASADAAFYFDPADYSGGSGRTTNLRLGGTVITNSVAPARDFVFALYPLTSFGGGSNVDPSATAGTATQTVTATAPAASSQVRVTSAVFAAPAAGWFALGLSLSGATATNSIERITATLHVQQV